MNITIIGAGNVGSALARGFVRAGHAVTLGVRDPNRGDGSDGTTLSSITTASDGADVVILAVPVNALGETIPSLGLCAGQVVIDATNAVRTPVPGGAPTVAAYVSTLVPDGVPVVKAFNTIGAEHLDGQRAGSGDGPPWFLPIAGDDEGRAVAVELASELGFDVADLGGPEAIEHVEGHARLWIHLAFAAGWGRSFGFAVERG